MIGSQPGVITFSPRRVNHEEHDEEHGHHAHERGDPETPTPTIGVLFVGMVDGCTQHVAEACPHWDGEVEERQDLGPGVLGVQIGDDGRSDGRVRSLADAHQGSKSQKCPEIGHERAQQGGYGPKGQSQDHDPSAAVSVSHVTEDGCEYHIRDDKGRLQKAQIFVLVLDFKAGLIPNGVDHTGHCRPVHVVDQIDKDQQKDRDGLGLVQ